MKGKVQVQIETWVCIKKQKQRCRQVYEVKTEEEQIDGKWRKWTGKDGETGSGKSVGKTETGSRDEENIVHT